MTSPFENIAECHIARRQAADAAIDDWQPEPVPLAVGLGALGNVLIRAEPDVSSEALERIAACVEEALATRGSVRDAATAGFLDALAHRADESPAAVERIVRHLGPLAREYVSSNGLTAVSR